MPQIPDTPDVPDTSNIANPANTANISKKNVQKCPHCHQNVGVTLGLNKNNIKRLFKKPTIDQWITLFILFLAISSFMIYQFEMDAINTYIDENCTCAYSYANQDNQINNNFKIDFTEVERIQKEYYDTKDNHEND